MNGVRGYLIAKVVRAYIYNYISLDQKLFKGWLYPLAPSPPPFHKTIYMRPQCILYSNIICHDMIVVLILYQLVVVMYIMVVTPVCPDQVSMLSQITPLISQQITLGTSL